MRMSWICHCKHVSIVNDPCMLRPYDCFMFYYPLPSPALAFLRCSLRTEPSCTTRMAQKSCNYKVTVEGKQLIS